MIVNREFWMINVSKDPYEAAFIIRPFMRGKREELKTSIYKLSIN